MGYIHLPTVSRIQRITDCREMSVAFPCKCLSCHPVQQQWVMFIALSLSPLPTVVVEHMQLLPKQPPPPSPSFPPSSSSQPTEVAITCAQLKKEEEENEEEEEVKGNTNHPQKQPRLLRCSTTACLNPYRYFKIKPIKEVEPRGKKLKH